MNVFKLPNNSTNFKYVCAKDYSRGLFLILCDDYQHPQRALYFLDGTILFQTVERLVKDDEKIQIPKS